MAKATQPEFATPEDRQPFKAEEPPAPPPAPWNPDMDSAPRDGRVILLTESLDREDGLRALWYTARGMARPWMKPPSNWLNAASRRWVEFTPVGWSYAP